MLILALEHGDEDGAELVDWASLRDRLGVPPEPAIDPETVDIDRASRRPAEHGSSGRA